MSKRMKTEFLGVKVILIPNWRARLAVKAVCSGSSVWLRLADGSIATNDAHLFKWAHIYQSKSDASTAEILWRLGAIPKSKYIEVRDNVKAHEAKTAKRHAISSIRYNAKKIGLTFTPAQLKQLAEASVTTA